MGGLSRVRVREKELVAVSQGQGYEYKRGWLHVVTVLLFLQAELASEKAGTRSEYLRYKMDKNAQIGSKT